MAFQLKTRYEVDADGLEALLPVVQHASTLSIRLAREGERYRGEQLIEFSDFLLELSTPLKLGRAFARLQHRSRVRPTAASVATVFFGKNYDCLETLRLSRGKVSDERYCWINPTFFPERIALPNLKDVDACLLPMLEEGDWDDCHFHFCQRGMQLITAPEKMPDIRTVRYYDKKPERFDLKTAEVLLKLCTKQTKSLVMDRVYVNEVPLVLYYFQKKNCHCPFGPHPEEWTVERCAHAFTHSAVPTKVLEWAIAFVKERQWVREVFARVRELSMEFKYGSNKIAHALNPGYDWSSRELQYEKVLVAAE
jgi:hypothetical protein